MKKVKSVIFSIAGTLLSATACFFWLTRKKTDTQSVSNPVPSKEDTMTTSRSTVPDSELYKTAGVKKLELKNIPESIKFNDLLLNFTGSARTSPTEHDKYNVDVFDNNGRYLGSIVKNRRLSLSLDEWHNGEVFAFGKIIKTNNESVLSGHVNLPVGLSKHQTRDIKSVFKKLEARLQILSKTDISSEEYLQILTDHKFISKVLFQLDIVDDVDAALSKKIIPALSKQLEDEKNTEGLLQLEKHSDLIDELSDRFAAATYKRIKKAKEKIL